MNQLNMKNKLSPKMVKYRYFSFYGINFLPFSHSVKIILTAMVLLFSFAGNAQIQKGTDVDGEAMSDKSGYSVSMPDSNTMAIGAIYNDDNGLESGHVRVYQWNGSTWGQKGADINGEVAYDYSGISVSMPDANTVAIGANNNAGNGTGSGHVRIYAWNGSAWMQKGTDLDGEVAGDNSGVAVSMPDANTVAIGARLNDGSAIDAGHVRIYEWSGSAWVQKGADIDGEAAGDFSGASVSMPDANTVAIGAYGNDGTGTDGGHVRIYMWNGGAWVQKGADIDGEAAGDFSGTSVSMPDANTVAIGANGNDGNGNFSGHVRIYTWNGSAWVQEGTDIDGKTAADHSGYSVNMPDPNTVAIGAPGPAISGKTGYVSVYEWKCNAWVQNGVDMDGEGADDQFGNTVSMPDNNTVAIGGRQNDGFAFNAGHTRVYTLPGSAQLITSTNSINASCGGSNGSASVTPTGGTPPYTYLWDLSTGSQADSTAINLAAGIYSVTVTDASGCLTAIETVEVLSSVGPSPPVVSTTDSLICSGESTQICVSGTYDSYLWNTGDSASCTTATLAGAYWLTVTDANGCSVASSRQNISIYPVPSVSVVVQGDTLSSFGAVSYQWYFNGAIIPGAISNIYIATSSGDYAVQITDGNGCVATSSNVSVDVTALDIPQVESNIMVYPNPFSPIIYIDQSMVKAIDIYDLTGRIVFSSSFVPGKSFNKVDLSELSPAMYWIKIYTGDHSILKTMLKE